MSEPVTIVGGGLAGLALGIGLRRQDVPVTVWEAGRYPRHRVCGEFISGRGQESLAALGLGEALQQPVIRHAISAGLYAETEAITSLPLPSPAICVSRFTLDALLAAEFRRLGGELREGSRWSGGYGPGIVRAGGRRVEPLSQGWRWFGLKIHAREVEPDADLEMHFVPRGYVGLCRLPSGEVNVCGLFRSRNPVPDLAERWQDWLCGPETSVLRSRLAGARFVPESLCSVAGLSLVPRRGARTDECCIGDALTMIPPVTGNGMSIAFESAEAAVDPLAAYSHGDSGWNEAKREIARRCDRRFASRLRWAALLQAAMFQPRLRSLLLKLTGHSPGLWALLFRRTR